METKTKSVPKFYAGLSKWIRSEPHPSHVDDLAQFLSNLGASRSNINKFRRETQTLRDIFARVTRGAPQAFDGFSTQDDWDNAMVELTKVVQGILERFTGFEMEYDEVQDQLEARGVKFPEQ